MSVLPCVETETGACPTHSILWLHGLGADGNDFAPIVPELVAPEWPALRFVFPHAPTRPVTVNGGMAMRAWYDIKGMDLADKQDAQGVNASVTQIEVLLAREIERGVPAERIVLAGFSQGGAIALSAGLRHDQRLAGIVALSTYLPLHETLGAHLAEANRATPIFWGHGQNDPVVPYAMGQMSQQWLVGHGYSVEAHSYRMAHQVCAEEIADLRSWLGARLQAA
ncbi:dienelactone hydrolase family protein [Oleiagrimonas sp. C23AA]|uniref:alpha/beta hydrolase n=1 Tax=Oleiagrimonas sp. C23AA TaxID=2719047 RepID=UPI00141EED66|nr:dienelactone hydrolase family protein [Oleiagrimonas sp. C23AA]NII11327.1 carboxylesterase [Oleiagrimonas sp. C23AA]